MKEINCFVQFFGFRCELLAIVQFNILSHVYGNKYFKACFFQNLTEYVQVNE